MRCCRGLRGNRRRGRPLIGSFAGPRQVLLGATDERDKKNAVVSRRRSGTHSVVRLAVIPLSGEVRNGDAPPSMEIYARSSKTVRLQGNPIGGVNRRAFLRPSQEKNRPECRRKRSHTAHRDSPRPGTSDGSARQLLAYVEERARRSRMCTESAHANHRGKQIQVKMDWLPERNPLHNENGEFVPAS